MQNLIMPGIGLPRICMRDTKIPSVYAYVTVSRVCNVGIPYAYLQLFVYLHERRNTVTPEFSNPT